MTTKTDAERYVAAMTSGHIDTCIAIEKRNDLYGYPPQLVFIGLRAIEEGRDPHEAIDAFIEDAALPKGRNMLGIIGTYGVDGYTPAEPVETDSRKP